MKDSKIVSYFKNKNELDLEKIINDYSSYIATIIDNMIQNVLSSEDKEEIVSDVFFIIWKNKEKLFLDKKLSSYIAGVTKNVVKAYLRNKKVSLDISDYENSLYCYDEIDFFDNEIDKIRSVSKSLMSIREIDRQIFIDFYYNSKSIKDIAKERKKSEFAIKQKIYRIRKKIKKSMSERNEFYNE